MSTGHESGEERGTSSRIQYEERDGTATVHNWYTREQTEALLPRQTEWGVKVFADGPPINIQVSATLRAAPEAAPPILSRTIGGTTSSPPVIATPRTTTTGPLDDLEFPDVFDPDTPFPPWQPPQPPTDPGGGGGGGGSWQAPVIVRLFAPDEATPIHEWTFSQLEQVPMHTRDLSWSPPGRPAPDSPALRKGWWRITVTPIEHSVQIMVRAMARRGRAPIQTTTISHRLLNKVLALAVEALTPQIRVDGNHYLRIYLGTDLEALYGVPGFEHVRELPGGASSQAKLRSLAFRPVPGSELMADLHARRDMWQRKHDDARTDGERLYFKKRRDEIVGKLEALANSILADDIAIRFDVAFQDASVEAYGLDIMELEGEAGVIYFTFNRTFDFVRIVALLHMRFTAAGQIAERFGLIPFDQDEVDDLIENSLHPYHTAIKRYMKDGLARAAGSDAVLVGARHTDAGWELRYFIAPAAVARPPHVEPLDVPTGPVLDPGRTRPVAPVLDPEHTRPGGPVLDPGRTRPGGPVLDPGRTRPGGLLRADVREAAQPTLTTVGAARSPVLPARPTALSRFTFEEGPALDRLKRIDCLIVIMMENRSFDHLLGDLPRVRPRSTDPYEGITNGSEAPFGGFAGRVRMASATSLGLSTRIQTSPNHHYDHVLLQMGGARGTMDGFAKDVALRTDSPQVAMSYYEEAQLPVYYRLVDEYKVCDHWFCAHPGPTWPNRWATLTGFTPELENIAFDDPRLGYLTDHTIFDSLTAAHLDWRYYESDFSIIRTYDRYRLDDTRVLPLDDERDGLAALLRGDAGPLPSVIFVEPNFVDVAPIRSANDDHAPADLADGQAFIAKICNMMWSSPFWNRLTLVVTYDEHGGFYDHVPPPGTEAGGAEWLDGRLGKLHPDGPTFMGPRVPTFIVSPYVNAGSNSRVVFDHTSIIKSILVRHHEKFQEPTLASYGQRVAVANHLGQALDRDTARPPATPFQLRDREVRVRRPGVGWDEQALDPRDFHTGLRRLFAPRPPRIR